MILSEPDFTLISRRRGMDDLLKILEGLERDGVVSVERDLEAEKSEAELAAFARGWMSRATT